MKRFIDKLKFGKTYLVSYLVSMKVGEVTNLCELVTLGLSFDGGEAIMID